MKISEVLAPGILFRHKTLGEVDDEWNISLGCMLVKSKTYRVVYLNNEGKVSWFYCDKGSYMEVFADVLFEVMQ